MHDNNNQHNTNINSLIKEILNALPYTAIILNKNREIVFANQVLINSEINISFNDYIGKRTGEALNCLNFNNSNAACGDTQNCKFCGMADVIQLSQITNKLHSQESRFTRIIDGIEYSSEFKVTASPFKWGDKDFTLYTMLDISEQTRKRALERIFFHDVLNKTGSLSGFFQLIKENEDSEEQKELLEIAETISVNLNEEIIYQKELMAAETGDLIIEKSRDYSKDVIEIIANQLSNCNMFKDYQIEIDTECINISIKTDIVLLKRILTNMLKNALEASNIDELVKIGCYLKRNHLCFFVHNVSAIPDDVQLQIFQRSFSTKGYDRGLGTYSMKLLGERYLKGKVHFISNEIDGTTFNFDLPLEN